jgi:hypothetical protein
MDTKTKGLTRLQGWIIIGLLAAIVGWYGLQVWWVQATTLAPNEIVEVRP